MLVRALASLAFLVAVPAAAQGVVSMNSWQIHRELMRGFGRVQGLPDSGPGAPRRTMNPNSRISFPENVRSAIRKAAVRNRGEWTEVRVPVVGTFRGLDVAAMVFGFGDNNGVNWLKIEFLSPIAAVRNELGRDVAEGNRRLNAKYQEVSAPGSDRMSIKPLAGKASLICDQST